MSQLIVARGQSPEVVASIHNYLADGGGENAALIDTLGDYSGRVWMANNGSETLSQIAPGNGSAHAIRCQTSGDDWEDGPLIGNIDNTFGGLALPSAFYQFGIDLKSPDGPIPCTLQIVSQEEQGVYGGQEQFNLTVTTSWQRFIIGIGVLNTARLLVNIYLQQFAYDPVPETVPSVKFDMDNAMLTEGDATTFRDGASSGWAWAGTANASFSSGPQP